MSVEPGGSRLFGALSRLACVLLLAPSLLFLACTTYQKAFYGVQGYTLRLDGKASVYIALPEDAKRSVESLGSTKSDEESEFVGSGRRAADLIAEAFRRHSVVVETASERQSLKEALKRARENGFDYLVPADLIQWTVRSEHRRDRVSMKVSVVDVASRKSLESVTLRGLSAAATGVSAEELLKGPVTGFVDSLYFKE